METIQIQLDDTVVQNQSRQCAPVPFYRGMFFILGIFQAVRQVVQFSWPDPQGRSFLAWFWLVLTWTLILQCMKAYHSRVRDHILLGQWIPAAMSTMALVLANNGGGAISSPCPCQRCVPVEFWPDHGLPIGRGEAGAHPRNAE